MDDETALLIVAGVVVVLYLFNAGKKSTGNVGITPGSGPMLPCCDVNGNIVDAGSSMYCPEGSTTTQCH
jgi:hypothetical protein